MRLVRFCVFSRGIAPAGTALDSELSRRCTLLSFAGGVTTLGGGIVSSFSGTANRNLPATRACLSCTDGVTTLGTHTQLPIVGLPHTQAGFQTQPDHAQ